MSVVIASILFPPIDPVIFRIGPVAVRWYGLAYLLGFWIAYVALRRLIRYGRLQLADEKLSNLVAWLAAGVIVGGRAGWWIFYHRGAGAIEPWYEPMAIWRGGMSFHGGLVGVVVALAFWSRRERVSMLNLADSLALVAPIGLFLGRIANFINAELVGRPTSVAWGVIFPGETFARHPSQLYEGFLEGPLLLGLLWLVARRCLNLRPGQLASIFILLYGLLRFAVEFTRQPDDQLGFIAFGWLTMGQLLSAALALAGATFSWLRNSSCMAGPTPGVLAH